MKFRKKPVVIEAVQYTGQNHEKISKFNGIDYSGKPQFIIISTLEGDHAANPGDWIIKGIRGEFYPCKADIFEATYEKIED